MPEGLLFGAGLLTPPSARPKVSCPRIEQQHYSAPGSGHPKEFPSFTPPKAFPLGIERSTHGTIPNH
jgi:hypothetical protein